MSVKELAIQAKQATSAMAQASTDQKNEAIRLIIEGLKAHSKRIEQANQQDILQAKANHLSDSMIDRLSLQGRLEGLMEDLRQVIHLPDPVGEIFESQMGLHHLEIAKFRVPLGVLGVIYESRPNVTLDISALCIKSGNTAILRGGSETLTTNLALIEVIQNSLIKAGLPTEAIQLISSIDRSEVNELLRLHHYIDLIIPRGGAKLHQFCRENSTIPVITGGIGICHLFVDESANIDKSLEVILNAKTQRPTVCNALDTLLVHQSVAESLIPKVIDLLGQKGVSFRLDSQAYKIQERHCLNACSIAEAAAWDTEWLSLVLGIKVVKNHSEAIQHIQEHSTGHSDGILTENKKNADHFIRTVDSAAVYVNASTRFTDGGQLGLGAEVAISTQKLHARGPMGLKELTSYKWIVRGNYTVRS